MDAADVPAWRRGKVRWILLHAFIGLVPLGALQLVTIGGLLGVARRDARDVELATLLAVAGALATGAAGWLLFVYLRRSALLRWTALLILLLGGLAGSALVAVTTQPPA